MFQFNHQTKVMGYDGAVEQQLGLHLQNLEVEHVLLVTDSILTELGMAKIIMDYIEDAGIEVTLFDGVLPDPPMSVVEHCINIIDENGIDVLVALGGGSSIDTAKAINMMKFGGKPLDEMADKLEGVPNKGLPLIAIPTTAGTGSEVTQAAVITNDKTTGRKMSLLSPSYAPNITFVDPQMSKGMPPSVTRSTGLDALYHGVEAATTNSTNVMCDAIAYTGIKMIYENLPKAVANGDDLEARLQMGLAATITGIAFTNTYVHLGHAFGHAIGALYHIPHGSAIALAFPWVMEFVADSIGDKGRILANLLGKDPAGVSEDKIPGLLRDSLIEFQDNLGEKRFSEYDMFKEADIPFMAEKTMLEGLLVPFAPKRMGKEEAINILTRAYHNIRD